MKKYDLSAIMKRAWELVKKAGMTISEGLKKAWHEVKETTKFEGRAKVEKSFGEKDSKYASSYLYFSEWNKYGKKRIYVNDYKRRTIGYIENGSFVKIDNNGCSNSELEYSISTFFSRYAI